MSMRLRLCDQDREQYGGPEWLEWSAVVDWLNDQDGDKLIDLDDELAPHVLTPNGPLVWLVSQVQLKARDELSKMRIARAWAWLSLRAHGGEVALADFKPKLMLMRPEFDADPPAGGEAPLPESTQGSPEASPESATSTSPSTPGSPSTIQE